MFHYSLFIIPNSRFKGQTVIEMLVVFAVTTFFLGIVLTFNRTAKNQNDLFQFSDKFILDIRKVQDLAYLSQQYGGADPAYQGMVPCGYGMLFDEAQKNRYTVFAAFNSDCSKVVNGEYNVVELETSLLPSLIKFGETSSNPVIFVPPYPRSLFFPTAESMIVKLVLSGQQGVFREISINKAGQISRIYPEE